MDGTIWVTISIRLQDRQVDDEFSANFTRKLECPRGDKPKALIVDVLVHKDKWIWNVTRKPYSLCREQACHPDRDGLFSLYILIYMVVYQALREIPSSIAQGRACSLRHYSSSSSLPE